jgi:hypothetical protein
VAISSALIFEFRFFFFFVKERRREIKSYGNNTKTEQPTTGMNLKLNENNHKIQNIQNKLSYVLITTYSIVGFLWQ